MWLLLACCAVAWASVYDGSECAGVFGDLSVDTNTSTSIDEAVKQQVFDIQHATPWMSVSCLGAIRTAACMVELYSLTKSYPYCESACASTLSTCESYFSLMQSLQLQVSPIASSCQNLERNSSVCFNGSMTTYTELPSICPPPLVHPDKSSYDDTMGGAYVFFVEGTECARGCPNKFVYSSLQWHVFKIFSVTMSVAGFLTSAYTFYCHITEKKWMIVFLTGGCCNLTFWLLIYFSLNLPDDRMLCQGNSGYLKRPPFCMFIAVLIIYCGLWCVGWSFMIALSLWLVAVRKWKQFDLQPVINKALIVISVAPGVVVAAGLWTNTIGTSEDGSTGQLCFFRASEDHLAATIFQALFVSPLAILVLGASVLLFLVRLEIKKRQEWRTRRRFSSVSSTKTQPQYKRYYQKQSAFTICFVMTLLFVLGSWEVANKKSKASYLVSTMENMFCLLKQASVDVHCPASLDFPNYFFQLTSISYLASLGIIPFLVYGNGGLFNFDKLRWRLSTMLESAISFSFTTPHAAERTSAQPSEKDGRDNLTRSRSNSTVALAMSKPKKTSSPSEEVNFNALYASRDDFESYNIRNLSVRSRDSALYE